MGDANRRGTEADRAAEAQQRDEQRQADAQRARDAQVQELKVQRACLTALVRAQGRVRISRRDIEAIEPGSRVDVVRDDLGVTLTFVAGDRAG